MPLKIGPDDVGFTPPGDGGSAGVAGSNASTPPGDGGRGKFNKPFKEQLDFFRQKLNLPSEHYDDIIQSGHDRAFIVAGAMKADLVQDFRSAIDRVVAEGKSIQWFREHFDEIVDRHGWHGWTGEDTADGRDWRTRIIYKTNLAASYAAGRYQQLTDPTLLKRLPYWKYIHNDTVTHPRPLHVAWSGLVLKHDNPWWQTHFPPNGWGCRCRITAVAASEYQGASAPDNGDWVKEDRIGQQHVIPNGIDYGWDYTPGRANAELLRQVVDKQESADWRLARANVAELVGGAVFTRFLNGQLAGEFPVAVLDDAEKALLGSEASVVLMSQASVADHLDKHPEITADDYRQVQQIIDQGEVYQQNDERVIYLWLGGELYRAALKRTQDRLKNYFLTLFKTTDKKADAEVRKKYKRIR